jgi:hypothetical protein
VEPVSVSSCVVPSLHVVRDDAEARDRVVDLGEVRMDGDGVPGEARLPQPVPDKLDVRAEDRQGRAEVVVGSFKVFALGLRGPL